jgi:hypothetical protein
MGCFSISYSRSLIIISSMVLMVEKMSVFAIKEGGYLIFCPNFFIIFNIISEMF